jgi:hypothetical protein
MVTFQMVLGQEFSDRISERVMFKSTIASDSHQLPLAIPSTIKTLGLKY